jgi:hypothetical protein
MSTDPLKLHNVIVVFDVYALAHDAVQAREVILAAIRDMNPLPPSEAVALPTSRIREVRAAWTGQKPFVADDVTDAEFESVKGKTTLEVFELLNLKAAPEGEPASAPKKKKETP